MSCAPARKGENIALFDWTSVHNGECVVATIAVYANGRYQGQDPDMRNDAEGLRGSVTRKASHTAILHQ
jgi:hypothetical protein